MSKVYAVDINVDAKCDVHQHIFEETFLTTYCQHKCAEFLSTSILQ